MGGWFLVRKLCGYLGGFVYLIWLVNRKRVCRFNITLTPIIPDKCEKKFVNDYWSGNIRPPHIWVHSDSAREAWYGIQMHQQVSCRKRNL